MLEQQWTKPQKQLSAWRRRSRLEKAASQYSAFTGASVYIAIVDPAAAHSAVHTFSAGDVSLLNAAFNTSFDMELQRVADDPSYVGATSSASQGGGEVLQDFGYSRVQVPPIRCRKPRGGQLGWLLSLLSAVGSCKLSVFGRFFVL